MAFGDNVGNFGTIGNVLSGISSYRALISGDILGALSGGLLGGDDDLSFGRQELEALGFDQFRDFGAFIVPQSLAIVESAQPILADLRSLRMEGTDLFRTLSDAIEAVFHSTSPQDAIDRNNNAANLVNTTAFRVDGFKSEIIIDELTSLADEVINNLNSNKEQWEQALNSSNESISSKENELNDVQSRLDSSGLLESSTTNIDLEAQARLKLELLTERLQNENFVDMASNVASQGLQIESLMDKIESFTINNSSADLLVSQNEFEEFANELTTKISDLNSSREELKSQFDDLVSDFDVQRDEEIGNDIDFNRLKLLEIGVNLETSALQTAFDEGVVTQEEFDQKSGELQNRSQDIQTQIEEQPFQREQLLNSVTDIIEGSSRGIKDIELQNLKLKLPELNELPIEDTPQGIDPLSISIGQSLGQQQQIQPIVPEQLPEDEIQLPETEGVAPVIGDIFKANEINERLRGKF